MNKSIKHGIRVGTCVLILTVTACSQDSVDPLAVVKAEPGNQAPRAQVSDIKVSAGGETPGQQVSGAITDLATRIGIAADAITVNEARVVNWGSSAIGCPQEGMNYTQAIVPGVLVILEAGGVSYRYHGRSEAELIYCPDERAKEPAYGPGQEFM